MDIIHLLPDSVANQIAAGEVIQRPASVIKELVENAVDAGAEHIDIVIVDAGRTSIQVVDDGKGMSETDARLAFERHATSKIRQASDLFALTTMGFRGEALPSIAAVSQVQLTTRTADEDLGTCLMIEGSKVVSQEPAACAVGSSFVIRNLFFNTPARRKFLKTNQTELNNIIAEVERIVLVHPETAFTLTSNGTTLMNLNSSNYKQRIGNVFGQKVASALLDVFVETPIVKLQGLVGKPESARRRGAQQFFFVNSRYMRHPYFHKAVQEAFTSLVPSEEQVPYFLYLTVNPEEIDVNIHPTKTEIKFENEQAIWQIITAAVREALGRFNAVPTIDFDTEGRPEIPVFDPSYNKVAPRPQVQIDTNFNPFGNGSSSGNSSAYQTERGRFATQMFNPEYDLSDEPSALPEAKGTPAGDQTFLFPQEDTSTEHYQFKGQYIMTAAHSGLMIIDQHRAHVRVLHDRYISELSKSPLPSQRLLFPDLITLTAAESATLQSINGILERLGFEITSLGGGSWNITATPAGMEGVDPQRLVADLIAEAAERGGSPSDQLISKLALVMARSAAIPAGQVLSAKEMQELVNQLFATSNPNLTPNGQPIIAILPQESIDKMFG
ncbi:MAG: DNA mismatch repair endonuclease MutL [Bacteroidaceae bacterium]|nr:DNA mismatch repair endonuclease MutL [Bacteroidaceae bacterium]